ncbi:MAG: SRPBCC family protein [Myxococcota bacterium]
MKRASLLGVVLLLVTARATGQQPAPAPTSETAAPATPPPAQPAPHPAAPAPAPAAPSEAPTFEKDELAKLEKGQVVVRGEMYTNAAGKRAGKGKAFVIINKPPEAPWAILNDYEKMPEFMPRLARVTIQNRTADGMKVVQELKVLFKTVRYVLDLKFDASKKRMAWALDKSSKNDINDTFGSWHFQPWNGGRTLVVYDIAVDTGAMIPAFLEEYLTKKDLPEVLMAMKRRAESGGTWKKD